MRDAELRCVGEGHSSTVSFSVLSGWLSVPDPAVYASRLLLAHRGLTFELKCLEESSAIMESTIAIHHMNGHHPWCHFFPIAAMPLAVQL